MIKTKAYNKLIRASFTNEEASFFADDDNNFSEVDIFNLIDARKASIRIRQTVYGETNSEAKRIVIGDFQAKFERLRQLRTMRINFFASRRIDSGRSR